MTLDIIPSTVSEYTKCSSLLTRPEFILDSFSSGYSPSIRVKNTRQPGLDDQPKEPNWLLPVISRLEEIVNLSPGWAGDDSSIPTPESVVIYLNGLLSFMPYHAHPPFVLPLYNGGIQLEWHCGGWDIDVEFEPGRIAEYWGENHTTGQLIDGIIGNHKELTDAIKTLNNVCDQCTEQPSIN